MLLYRSHQSLSTCFLEFLGLYNLIRSYPIYREGVHDSTGSTSR
jgi:hypothetical protein